MEAPLLTSEAYFKKLGLIHIALIGGVALFAGVVYFLLTGDDVISEAEEENIIKVVLPIVAVSSVIATIFIPKNLLAKAKNKELLESKMGSYFSITIIRLALLEGAGLTTTVGALLTGDMNFFYLILAIVIFMVVNRPTPDKAIQELDLSEENAAKVKDAASLIARDPSTP